MAFERRDGLHTMKPLDRQQACQGSNPEHPKYQTGALWLHRPAW